MRRGAYWLLEVKRDDQLERVAMRLLIACCLLVTAASCGPIRSASQPSLPPGVPHCAAAESAAAHAQQYEQSTATESQPPVSVIAAPPPSPTTGTLPPTPSPMPTAVPIIVTAALLDLGPEQLSSFPPGQYVVRVGTLVNVRLPDESPPFCWSVPTLSTASVLSVLEAGDDLGGGAHALFRAIGPGIVTIDTTNACYTFPACGAAEAITEAVLTVRE
jgi:hypothetical protein